MASLIFFILLATSNPLSATAQDNKNQSALTNRGTENEYYAANDCKALLLAVKEKDSAKVAALLKTLDTDCVYGGGGEPRTALVSAARNGDLVIGKLLIDAGAAVEFHAEGDETPLMAAASTGKLDFVKYLVSNGAAINIKLKGEGTALLIASREGHVETVKYLIEQGAEIDAVVGGDGSPLINAVRNRHYEIVKILLENGADPYLTSPGDENPMHHARETKDRMMISLLKKYEKEN